MIQEFTNHLSTMRYSANTIRTYITNLHEFATWAKANAEQPTWRSINSALLQQYIISLSAAHEPAQEIFSLKTNSILVRRTCLSSLFAYMVKCGYRKDNPTKGLVMPRNSKTIRQPLEQEVVERAISDNEIDLKTRSLIALMVESGLRISEAININTTDIDKKNMRIKVIGKGRKARYVYYGKVTQTLMNSWVRHKGLVFTENERNARYKIHIGLLKAGASKEAATPHNLRHLFACNNLDNGMRIEMLSQLMGHEQITTTQRYAHLNKNTIKSAPKAFLG